MNCAEKTTESIEYLMSLQTMSPPIFNVENAMTVLRIKLPAGMTHEAAVERLGAADFTEPLVGVGTSGVIALAYERELTADEVASLIAQITRVLPGAGLPP